MMGMAVENGGQLEKGGKLAAAAMILGIAVGLLSLFVAYEISYEGAGPGPGDTEMRIIVTFLIVSSMIFAIVMILMGAVSFLSPGMSGEEVSGYVEVRRKRP